MINSFFKKAIVKIKLQKWYNIALFSALGAVLIGTVLWMLFSVDNKTIFDISANNPSGAHFYDENVMNFSVNDENTSGAQSVSLPEVNNNRQLSDIQPLYISFNLKKGQYLEIFKMNQTLSDLEKNIKITPFIKGKWGFNGSDSLVFTPARDWPAGQKFNVKINKNLFNQDISLTNNTISFETQKLNGKIESFESYPDSSKQKHMISISVISFNYPVDTINFADKVSLKNGNKKMDFNVKFDSYNRTAFITSESVPVSDKQQKIKLSISNINSAQGNSSSEKINASATIESEDNFFRISDISSVVVDNQEGEPEQLVILNMTAPASDVKWQNYVNIYLLPKTKDENENKSHIWRADEITPDVLSKSKIIETKHIDFANPTGVYQYAFSYDVSEKDQRYIYVSVNPGFVSDIGFPLKNGWSKIISVPYPNKEVKIAGTGALLSMSGDKKLGIVARGGISDAYINLSKVKSSEINHLISQTYNIFSGVDFKGYSFGAEDISVVFKKKISFSDSSLKKVNYSSIDLGEYLNKTNDHTGIFIIRVGETESQSEYANKKLILLTDLGIIRKVNYDNSSSIFVSSISKGGPVSGASVSVLGRNGNAIWTGETNANGRANITQFAYDEYKNEKEPVAFVVRNGDDVSFIPYQNSYEQQVEFSKFDIDGVYAYQTNPLNAYLFSDRGIYRPGEKFIIGGIVKDKNFKSLSGIPVRFEVRDSRSKVILEKTFSLSSDGFFDIEKTLSNNSPIGDYQARIYSLNDKNNNKDILGSLNFRIEEFVPDNLKISSSIIGAKPNGWINTKELKADVSLRNLFGTPATDRRISSRAVLTPVQFSFPQFPGYEFTPNYISGTGLSKKSNALKESIYQNLPDAKTDNDGKSEIDIAFTDTINPGTYMLSFTADGFEGNSGKSVQSTTTTKVSDAKYLIGFKSNSDLGYITKGAKRSINIISINNDAQQQAVQNLSLRIVKKQNLISLVKDYNDYYKYQNVVREKVIKTSNISIPKTGMDLKLDTESSGSYYIDIIDENGKILAHSEYFIAGTENYSLDSDTGAELKIKLNKKEYAPGTEIEVNITSPYVGSGLITIEKDKVYAHKWFKSNTTSSVQHITLPDDFEGSGYINVSFVRDINSRDIFTTPYTYAVQPFWTDKSKRTINIDLKTPDIVRDKKLTVNYKTDKNAKIMIFAVNEGILQVAKYQNPKPVDFFFTKSALQVSTYQILSLILPEYKILREFAKTGGGDYDKESELKANVTNPFARAVNKPVAFYSGILKTDAGIAGKITFDIPDYFNGGIRVYAVAANDSAMGSARTDSKIQSPVIISPASPLMAVPGDEFTVNAVISNMTENSGADAKLIASVKTSDNLEITGMEESKINIPQNSEKLWKFTLRAKDILGNASFDINASISDTNNVVLSKNTSTSTLSIRPAGLFTTNVISKYTTDKKTKLRDFQINQYNQFGSKELFISDASFILIKPLFEYLNSYSYSCSEQTVSRAIPYALITSDEFLGINNSISEKKVIEAINILKNRQNDNGSFALWDGAANFEIYRNMEADTSTAYVTAYVVQFLTIAKENGFNVPSNMLSRSVDFLRTYAGKNIRNNYDAEVKAFAIYLITRNSFVTTGYIDGFEEYANKNMKDWTSGISGAYIASSYKMLKQDEKANNLIKKYKISDSDKFVYYYDFANNISNDANYVYLVNKYFDGDISKDKVIKIQNNIMSYIASGNFSSFTSAVSIMALSGASRDGTSINEFISVVGSDGKNSVNMHPSDSKSKSVYKTNLPDNVKEVEITCNDCNRDHGVFYTILQQGFAKEVTPKNNGIEIVRDYYTKDGDKISSATVGDEITVKISIRATGGSDIIDNVVIADLLPGGFDVVSDSVIGSFEFSEVREDRVIIYTSISKYASEITYRAKLTTVGNFATPGIQAESMYNPQIIGISKSSKFKVSNAKEN